MTPRPMEAQRVEGFAAWRIVENSLADGYVRLNLGGASTLAEAEAEAVTRNFLDHKEHFCIHVENAVTGKAMVHFYAVKQRSKYVRMPHSDGTTRTIRPMYAAKLFAMQVKAFAPVERRMTVCALINEGSSAHVG